MVFDQVAVYIAVYLKLLVHTLYLECCKLRVTVFLTWSYLDIALGFSVIGED